MSNKLLELFEEGKLNPIVENLYVLYLLLRGGYWRVKDAFHIWKIIMTWDLERLNKRFCGLNAFDEFYSVLNGSWDGDR